MVGRELGRLQKLDVIDHMISDIYNKWINNTWNYGLCSIYENVIRRKYGDFESSDIWVKYHKRKDYIKDCINDSNYRPWVSCFKELNNVIAIEVHRTLSGVYIDYAMDELEWFQGRLELLYNLRTMLE